MPKRTTLFHPDGRKYETADPVEITRLKAHGYTETDPKKPAPKPASGSSGSGS